MEQYDFLVVGSGLFGATFAHLAFNAGKKCLVLDKRRNPGGNLYCENIEGINVHKYGAHIFHTSNKPIWSFVNNLVSFNRYTNCPLANYKGRLYNLPFNMNTFYQIWGVTTPEEAMKTIRKQRSEVRITDTPKNLEEQALQLVGKDVYNILIKGYTEKQWGRPCSELPAFIIRRLPLRFTFDNNYFNDDYQGIPIGGYNRLIAKLLEGSKVITNVDFFSDKHKWISLAKNVVYTGPIDEYYGFRLGRLQYRTVQFEQKIMDIPNYQGNAVINYTDRDVPYTRIIEHKHFEKFGQDVFTLPKTVISWEYSVEFQKRMEPYYPVNDEENNLLYKKYEQLSLQEKNVYFGGRLAEYKYYDMAPTIERAMELARKLLIV